MANDELVYEERVLELRRWNACVTFRPDTHTDLVIASVEAKIASEVLDTMAVPRTTIRTFPVGIWGAIASRLPWWIRKHLSWKRETVEVVVEWEQREVLAAFPDYRPPDNLGALKLMIGPSVEEQP